MKIFNVFPTNCRTEPEQVLKNKNDITDLKNDLTTAKNDLATLKAEVDNLKIDDDTLKQKISALETSINNIEASFNALDESVGKLQEASQNQALEIQENKENITKNTNNIDALDNRITAAEDSITTIDTTIDGIRQGSIPVSEAENVNNLLANYLTASSTQDEINNAISDFENKEIPIYFKMPSGGVFSLNSMQNNRLLFSYFIEFLLDNGKWKFSNLNIPIIFDYDNAKISNEKVIIDDLKESQVYIVPPLTSQHVSSIRLNFLSKICNISPSLDILNDYYRNNKNLINAYKYGIMADDNYIELDFSQFLIPIFIQIKEGILYLSYIKNTP